MIFVSSRVLHVERDTVTYWKHLLLEVGRLFGGLVFEQKELYWGQGTVLLTRSLSIASECRQGGWARHICYETLVTEVYYDCTGSHSGSEPTRIEIQKLKQILSSVLLEMLTVNLTQIVRTGIGAGTPVGTLACLKQHSTLCPSAWQRLGHRSGNHFLGIVLNKPVLGIVFKSKINEATKITVSLMVSLTD